MLYIQEEIGAKYYEHKECCAMAHRNKAEKLQTENSRSSEMEKIHISSMKEQK